MSKNKVSIDTERLQRLVKEFNDLKPAEKAYLTDVYPGLYHSVSWIVRAEEIRQEMMNPNE